MCLNLLEIVNPCAVNFFQAKQDRRGVKASLAQGQALLGSEEHVELASNAVVLRDESVLGALGNKFAAGYETNLLRLRGP